MKRATLLLTWTLSLVNTNAGMMPGGMDQMDGSDDQMNGSDGDGDGGAGAMAPSGSDSFSTSNPSNAGNSPSGSDDWHTDGPPPSHQWPPECVAHCDWTTGCPDIATCDTSGCQGEEKDMIDAFIINGCEHGDDDQYDGSSTGGPHPPSHPGCVDHCDWTTGCPDFATCDTSGCPANEKDMIDAYIMKGCDMDQMDGMHGNSPSGSDDHVNDPVNTGNSAPSTNHYNNNNGNHPAPSTFPYTGWAPAPNPNSGPAPPTTGWAPAPNNHMDATGNNDHHYGTPSPTNDQHHWNGGSNSAPSTNHANINGNHPAPSYNSGPKYPNTGWAPAPNNHMGATGNNDHHYGTPSPTNNQHPWNSGGNSAPSTNHDNNNGNHPAPSYNSGPAPPHTGWAPSPTNNNGFVPSASPTNNNPHHGPSCGSSEDCMSYCENNDIGIESSHCRIPGLLYCDTHHRCQTDPIKLNDQPDRHGASYCGPGTDWEEETQTCVATYNGMLEACEESRGKNWGWTCKNQAAASCTTGLSDDGSQKEHTEPLAPAPATAPHNGDHESATGNVEDPGKIRRLRRLTRRSSVRTFQKGPK